MAAKSVEKGVPDSLFFLPDTLSAFPFILSQMVAVGEETGKMDDVLTKISHIFEVEAMKK